MSVLQSFEGVTSFFGVDELDETETSVILRVDFFGQSDLLQGSIWFEELFNFVSSSFKGQIFDHEFVALSCFAFDNALFSTLGLGSLFGSTFLEYLFLSLGLFSLGDSLGTQRQLQGMVVK
jgi:hypothetical protein